MPLSAKTSTGLTPACRPRRSLSAVTQLFPLNLKILVKTNPTNVPAEPSLFRMLVLAAAALAVYAAFSVARAQNPAQNKQHMKTIYDAFDTGNLAALDHILATDCVDYTIPPGMKNGLEGDKEFFALFKTAFPDAKNRLEDLIAEGDYVAARVRFVGTHDGPLMGQPATPDLKFTPTVQVAEGDRVITVGAYTGTQTGDLMGIPPSGKPIDLTNIVFDRYDHGLIAERWDLADQFGLLQQLGVIPTDEQAKK